MATGSIYTLITANEDYEYIKAKRRMDLALKGDIDKGVSYQIKKGNISLRSIEWHIKLDFYGVEILTMLIRKKKVKILYNLLDTIHNKHNKLLMGCSFFYKLKWHKRFLNSNTIKEELRLLYRLQLPADILNVIQQYILNSY